jgi:HEAT repeat protein
MVNKNKVGGVAISQLAEKGDFLSLITIVEQNIDKTNVKLAILALGDLKCPDAVETIIYALLSQFVSVRCAAIQALGKIGDPKATKPLLKLLQNFEENPATHELILEALGKIASEEAIQAIINMLDTDLGVKAVSVLEAVGKPAVDPLLASLANANQAVKIAIIKILGEIGDWKATSPLISLFEKEKNNDIWGCDMVTWALHTLGRLKDPKSIKPLIDAIKYDILETNKNYPVQCSIILALGEIGDKRAIQPLVRLLLENDQSRINYSAALGIVKIGVSGCNNKLAEQISSISQFP